MTELELELVFLAFLVWLWLICRTIGASIVEGLKKRKKHNEK